MKIGEGELLYKPVAQQAMKVHDKLLFLKREFSTLDVGTQVVRPPQSAALTTSQQSCSCPHASTYASLSLVKICGPLVITLIIVRFYLSGIR